MAFATSGPVGGHIRIAGAGKPLLDRPLADEVEDSYRLWSDDPRYRTWTTQPEFRNFIGEPSAPK